MIPVYYTILVYYIYYTLNFKYFLQFSGSHHLKKKYSTDQELYVEMIWQFVLSNGESPRKKNRGLLGTIYKEEKIGGKSSDK